MKNISWHRGGASYERRQSGFFCLELLPILPLSSVSRSHAHLLCWPPPPSFCVSSLKPNPCTHPYRILLQGLISFPFLERLFKFCYIYSQQQHSPFPSFPSSTALMEGKVLFFSSVWSVWFPGCPVCVCLFPSVLSVLTLHRLSSPCVLVFVLFCVDADDIACESLYRVLCFLSFTVACFFVYVHKEYKRSLCNCPH